MLLAVFDLYYSLKELSCANETTKFPAAFTKPAQAGGILAPGGNLWAHSTTLMKPNGRYIATLATARFAIR